MTPRRLRGLSREWWAVGLLLSLAAALLLASGATRRLDNIFYDLALRLDRHDPDPRILIVAIDDAALKSVGAWPWPRSTDARLLEQIQAAGPGAIAYDILFIEPQPGDPELARAMKLGAPVIAPLLIDAPGNDGRAVEPRLPVAGVVGAAAALGHVELAPDSDGIVRRMRPSVYDGTRAWPQLMQETVRQFERSIGHERLPVKKAESPVLIAFGGAAGSFPTVSAGAVLQGNVPHELMQGRIILVAVTAQGLGDQHPVPRGLMSGVEIQANYLDGLLAGRGIEPARLPWNLIFTLFPCWLLLALLRFVRPRTALAAVVVLAVATVAASIGALVWLRIWFPPVPALASLAILYPLWAWRRLSAVTSYMVKRLDDLRREPDLFAPDQSVPEGDPVGRQMILLDLAIARLRDMRRFVADSLQNLPDAVFVVDKDGAIQFANDPARRLARELSPASEGMSIAAVLAPCKRTSTLPTSGACDSNGALWPPAEGCSRLEIISPAGSCFDFRFIERRTSEGKMIGWLVRLTDITAIWTAQRQREDVLQFLSHDMRSPQASILAILAESPESEVSASVARRIETYARRTLALADGFVQLARAELAEYHFHSENLADILTDAVDDLWPQAQAKRLVVQESGLESEYWVRCERSLLTRAFVNLLDNAVKYSAAGGTISVKLERDEGASLVHCAIGDDGAGIQQAQLRRLFERFSRGPARAGDRVEGVGLGLSIVHAVVTRHSGSVTCTSSNAGGTVFTVSLPLADPPAGYSPEEAEQTAPR